MNSDGSNQRSLTASLDRTVSNPRWASDSRSVYVQYTDHGVNTIAQVTLDGNLETVASAARPSQSAQKAQAILGWFARYSSNEK